MGLVKWKVFFTFSFWVLCFVFKLYSSGKLSSLLTSTTDSTKWFWWNNLPSQPSKNVLALLQWRFISVNRINDRLKKKTKFLSFSNIHFPWQQMGLKIKLETPPLIPSDDSQIPILMTSKSVQLHLELVQLPIHYSRLSNRI